MSNTTLEYLPKLLCLDHPKDKVLFEKLCHTSIVIDEIDSQLTELIILRNPTQNLSKQDIDLKIKELLQGNKKENYGTWVYYSWLNKIVHTLNKNQFIEIRTSRNLYKITPDERNTLGKKHVGIIGLSVGQSAAITMASERCFGRVTLADFDLLELSNLNRIRSGIQNIGLPKTIIVAREIAEIDPFIEITCLHEGITLDNIDSFFTSNGPLDLVIDECDSLEIKILCRQKAKEYSIPLVMEMSDRGLIDIERHDISPDYPPFHGALKDMDIDLISLQGLSNTEKLPYLLAIHPVETLSKRMRSSLTEMGKSIKTWPQLASAVSLGGGVICDTSRKILLKQPIPSGRFFIDLEKLIPTNPD